MEKREMNVVIKMIDQWIQQRKGSGPLVMLALWKCAQVVGIQLSAE